MARWPGCRTTPRPAGRASRVGLQAREHILHHVFSRRLVAHDQHGQRAHSLATLALEEIGKAHLCVLVVIPPLNVISEEDFWKSWRDHKAELLWAFGLVRVIINQPQGSLTELHGCVADESSATHLAKMRGFYVDYADDGTVQVPADITAAEAAAVINDAQASLDFLTPSWGDEGIFDRIGQLDQQADQFAALHASIMSAIEVRPEATLTFGTG